METFDPNTQRRVWQRVAENPPQREDLRPLILSAQEAAADYRFLMGQLKGPAAEEAKKLWEGAQTTVACLLGLQQLRGTAARRNAPLHPGQQKIRRVLESSFHRCRHLAVEFTARSADSQCGMVFACLAQREQENCLRVAALMGMTVK